MSLTKRLCIREEPMPSTGEVDPIIGRVECGKMGAPFGAEGAKFGLRGGRPASRKREAIIELGVEPPPAARAAMPQRRVDVGPATKLALCAWMRNILKTRAETPEFWALVARSSQRSVVWLQLPSNSCKVFYFLKSLVFNEWLLEAVNRARMTPCSTC